MIPKVVMTPVIGLPKLDAWSQVASLRGNAGCIAFSIFGSQAGNVGRDLVDQIKDSSAPDSSALFYTFLNKLIRLVEEKDCQLQLAATLFLDTSLVLATYHGSILLRRNAKIGHLLSSEDQLQLINGQLRPDDLFILLTQNALDFKGEIEQKLTQGWEAETIVTSLMPSIQSSADTSLVAMAFIFLGQAKEVVEPKFQVLEPEPMKPPLVRPKFPPWLKYFLSQQFKRLFNKKKIAYIIFATFLVLLLLLSIFFTLKYQALSKKIKTEAAPSLLLLQEAQDLSATDKIKARELVKQSLDNLSNLDQQYKSKFLRQQIATAQTLFTNLAMVEAQDELNIFFDLNSVVGNFVSTQAKLIGEKIYFLDKDQQSIIELNIKDKSTAVSKFTDINSAQDLAVADHKIYLLADALYQIDRESSEKQKIEQALKAGARGLQFFNETLYVLNQEERNIFKYRFWENKWQEPIRYVKSAPGVDFSEILSMSIDGNLWLTSKKGEIFKFSAGTKQDFTVIGVDDPFAEAIYLYTGEDLQNLYILEPGKKRLVILDKEGRYEKQIVSETLATANNLLVSEVEKKAFVVSGSLVFEIDI